VQMVNRLASLRIGIDHGSISGPVNTLLLCHASGYGQQVAEKGFILIQIFIKRSNVFTWDHKHVNGSFWIDILKNHAVLVFIEDPGRRLVSGHPAKNTPEQFHHPAPIRIEQLSEAMRKPHLADALDIGSESSQFLLNMIIAAIQMVYPINQRFPRGYKGRQYQ
jgi:hypothetical protein